MSELAKKARAERKAKAERYARTDPHAKVDASGYTPPDALDADVKTGLRPVSRRQFKRGGKVEGEHAKHHAGRKPRKSGGNALTADSFQNRDVKEANENRDGLKHTGGMKRGGRAHKDAGGIAEALSPAYLLAKNLKRGGKAMHDDAAEDKKLIHEVVKKSAIKPGKKHGGEVHPKGCKCHKCGGGMAKKGGGSVSDGELEGTRPTGGRKARAAGGIDLDSLYGKESLPSKHSDAHKDFKAFKDMGWLKDEDRSGFLRKATEHLDKRAPRKSGGRAKGKGKTNINIIIAAHGGKGHQPMDGDIPGAPAGGLHQGAPNVAPPPPPGMPAGGPPGGGAPAMPPMPPPATMMPRKRGGRVHYPIKHASGGGLGRLEKIKAYGLKPAR